MFAILIDTGRQSLVPDGYGVPVFVSTQGEGEVAGVGKNKGNRLHSDTSLFPDSGSDVDGAAFVHGKVIGFIFGVVR